MTQVGGMNGLLNEAGVLVDVHLPKVVSRRQEVTRVRTTSRVHVSVVREWLPYASHLPTETTRERGIVVADSLCGGCCHLLLGIDIHPEQLVSLGVYYQGTRVEAPIKVGKCTRHSEVH